MKMQPKTKHRIVKPPLFRAAEVVFFDPKDETVTMTVNEKCTSKLHCPPNS